MKEFVFLIGLVGFSLSCYANGPVSHKLFDEVLKEFVDEKGWVDYQRLQDNSQQLQDYLKLLQNNHPNDSWSKNEQLAYWINAYNAFTLQLIIEKYPVESIKDIGSWIQIPFVNTPWDISFIEIGDETYDLNNIEHDILRSDFDEPRIHFAIVCASYSCPRLNQAAYTAENIDGQLAAAAKDFLNDPRKNKINANNPELSKIFSWFGGDFKKKTTLIEFINQYSEIEINPDADISFLDYDWRLNDQKMLK